MLKKIIITFLISFTCLFWINYLSADSIPVESIFSDIDENYKYLEELQTLYDYWMIKPDINRKFNPLSLLNRDEFVWILMEVSCEDCIQPNTALDLIKEYEDKQPFFDVNKNNKYYYCVSDANEQWFVKGYHPWRVCDNGTSKEWEIPYCPENTIILEEAIAVLLRASWILTNEEAENVRQDIYNWLITEILSDDVSPKNLDGSVYSFYPDFQKALEYEIMDVDTDGNVTISTLLEVKDWKLRPKQAVSKEDFLRIAYLTLKANSCDNKEENALALKIIIYDKNCNENINNCELSDLDDPNDEYDFTQEIYTVCQLGVTNPEWYIWRFFNEDTWQEIKKYWKYIDNYKFLSNWEWSIFLRVIDNCGNTTEVHSTINIDSNTNNVDDIDLKVFINANPIHWVLPLLVNFEWIVEGGVSPYRYNWDFWDWNYWLWKDIKNIFKEEWNYETSLIITDSEWNRASSTVVIEVIEDKDLAIKIIIYDSECSVDDTDCELSDLEDEDNTFDFTSEVFTTCERWIPEPTGYIWRFFNQDTWQEIKKYWKYIDDYEFLSSWLWIVYLKIIDNCWTTWEVFNSININIEDEIDTDLRVTIDVDPTNWSWPLFVSFEWIVTGWVWPYTYDWDFRDWNIWIWKEINNIFIEEWSYLVNLLVTDDEWETVNATTLIYVIWNNNCDIDSDNDWVNDCDDLCPLIKWDIKNRWCPIFEPPCDNNSDCENGTYCENGTNVCVPKLLEDSCEYSWGDAIFWNVICRTCPCNNYLDFISTLRKCDVIFPAITSRDSKTIYSKWELFNIGE